MKVAIIGAGSTYTPELIEGIIQNRAQLGLDEVAMMDIDAEKLRIVGGLAVRMLEKAQMRCRTLLTEDLDEALCGADYVLAQIRVGRLPARYLDETIPLKYGLLGQDVYKRQLFRPFAAAAFPNRNETLFVLWRPINIPAKAFCP